MSFINVPAIDSELLKLYSFWSGILILKFIMMPLLTIRCRFKKGVFMNEADCDLAGVGKVAFNDPDIERIRRSHLNDLENIPLWFITTILWLTTGPNAWLAGNLIRAFVLARIGHTFTYAICPKQPYRALFFGVAICITTFEAISTILYYF